MNRQVEGGWGLYGTLVFVAAMAVILFAAHCSAAITDAIDATCRISAGGARGTGCAFERSRGYVYVLTCAHVVEGKQAVNCEFWNRGHQSRPIAGTVVARSQQADAAVIAIPERAFGGRLPKIIPLAKRDTQQRGGTLTSVGCARGAWSTAWKGHVLGYSQDGDLHFTPTPADGRSGSALFDGKAERIVGLIRARTADDSQGIATSVGAIRRALSGKTSAVQSRGNVQTQCPGGVCPDGVTQYPIRPYLLPYRYRQQFRNQPQSPVYPTLPAPSAPSVDLGPTNQKLDRIAELLIEMRREQRAEPIVRPPPLETLPPPPTLVVDNEARTAAADAKLVAETAVQEVKAVKVVADGAASEVKVSMQEVSGFRNVLNTLIGDRETLRERVEARIAKVKDELGEEASKREIGIAYLKDLVREKLAGGGGLTAGKLMGGALGLSGPLALALGLGLWFVSRRVSGKIESGEPLLIQRLIERVTDKLDDLKDRVHNVETVGGAKKT